MTRAEDIYPCDAGCGQPNRRRHLTVNVQEHRVAPPERLELHPEGELEFEDERGTVATSGPLEGKKVLRARAVPNPDAGRAVRFGNNVERTWVFCSNACLELWWDAETAERFMHAAELRGDEELLRAVCVRRHPGPDGQIVAELHADEKFRDVGELEQWWKG